MISDDYWNHPFSQAEKRKELERDRDCFRTRAESDAALEAQGRFKKTNETTVVGATPSAPYPQQPSTSPWSRPDRNVEPPFDTDISAVEPILLPASSTDPDGGHSPGAGTESPTKDGIAVGLSTPRRRWRRF
jgi:hypothetical protein